MPNKKTRNIFILVGSAATLAGLIAVPLLLQKEETATPTFSFNSIAAESELQQYLNKKVVVSGTWYSSGVDGTYVTNDSKTAAIYVISTSGNDLDRVKSLHFVHFDGQPVTLSGTLEKLPAESKQGRYYFDVSNVKDSPSSFLNIGWVQAQSTNVAQLFSQHRSR